MRKKIKLAFGPGIEVEEIELRDGRWSYAGIWVMTA